jgi:predicted flap endonuclease-1-like 5' DNA nuclease
MHWLELPGNGYLCCGFSALDHLDRLPAGRSLIDQFNRESGRKIFPAGDREVPAAAMLEGKDGAWRSADVSPRLAFLTGRPLPLNRAGGGELTLVPGIGPYLAANILSYRSRHGSIDSERELTAVTGIGRVRAARLSPYLSFE